MGMPSKALFGVELIRALYEYLLACILNVPLQFISPKGDGHPVLIIPGFGTSDSSTIYLRKFLRSLGYEPYSWGFGRNMGPTQGLQKLVDQLHERVKEISIQSDNRQVSIIGWSIGGIYGREIAKSCPDIIRQVITLGSPFKGDLTDTNVSFIYNILNKDKDKSHKNPELLQKMNEPPPVPFTSLYSKTDGVVDWRSSIEREGPLTENIEIPGASHLGMSHNPIAMYVIADRLSKNKDSWSPYKK